jgi:hypothetical protein
VAQVIKYLPSKSEDLSSNPSTIKKKERKKEVNNLSIGALCGKNFRK